MRKKSLESWYLLWGEWICDSHWCVCESLLAARAAGCEVWGCEKLMPHCRSRAVKPGSAEAPVFAPQASGGGLWANSSLSLCYHTHTALTWCIWRCSSACRHIPVTWMGSTFFSMSLSSGMGWSRTVQNPPSLMKDCSSGVREGQTGIKLVSEPPCFWEEKMELVSRLSVICLRSIGTKQL